MHINFDGTLTGDTADAVRRAAEARGIGVHALLTEVLAQGLADRLSPAPVKRAEVKVDRWTANEGCNGFHVLTFVTDGYGNLIAEDADGIDLASQPWEVEGFPHDNSVYEPFAVLARQATERQRANES